MIRFLCNLTCIIVAALALSGCNETRQFVGECQSNDQCPVGAFCKGGLCACRSDEACAAGEVCNTQGVCQARAGCRRNEECPDPAATFCDIATGQCIPKTGCGADVHCPPGLVCDKVRNTCSDGCFDNADCPLYTVCQKNVSDPNALGSCLRGICGDLSFCDYGENCVNGMCAADANPNHCQPCNNQPGDCGGSDNFCLINPNYDANDPSQGSQYFCGVACDPEATSPECPNGYGCGRVVLLTQALCTPGKHSECCTMNNAGECCTDGQADCGPSKRQCVGGEGDRTGNCTCLTNQDCNIDTIPPRCMGTCGGLGLQPCLADTDCITTCVMDRNTVCQWPQGRSCTMDSECESLPLCAPIGGQQLCVWSGATNQTPCTQNSDCLCVPDQMGGPSRCFGTGRECTTGADCELTCSNGGCILGATCAPQEGLSCEDVR